MAVQRKREPGVAGSFYPANPLEELLIQAFREPAARPVFCRRMLASGLLVLGTVTETGVSLRQWTVGGHKVIPVFTSRQRMEEFAGPNDASLALAGRTIFKAIPAGVSVFLNPRTPIGREFPPEEIAGLLANTPEEPAGPDDGEGAPDGPQG